MPFIKFKNRTNQSKVTGIGFVVSGQSWEYRLGTGLREPSKASKRTHILIWVEVTQGY